MSHMNQMPNIGSGNFTVNMQDQGRPWNDEAMVNDVLSTEKAMIGGYATTSVETTCQNLRRVLTENYTTLLADQYTVYDAMKQRNWYPSKNAPAQEVQDAKTMFSNMRNTIPQ